MNWAPVLSLCQEPGRFTGPAYKSSFNPASWAWRVGLRAYFLNSIRKHIPFKRKFEKSEFCLLIRLLRIFFTTKMSSNMEFLSVRT